MRPPARFRAALAALGAALPAAAGAQADDDVQLWNLNVAQGRFAGRGVWYAEAQPRYTNDLGRMGQLLLRPALGVQLRPDVQALAGYAYVRTDPLGGAAVTEHRAWQQLQWPIVRTAAGLRVTARSRLEQRVVAGDADLGWRLRQQVRAQVPLGPRAEGVSGVVWTEPFVQFNATSWGARRGVDQWRTFVGVAVPLAPGLSVEPGYMQQRVALAAGERTNHVLSVSVFLRR